VLILPMLFGLLNDEARTWRTRHGLSLRCPVAKSTFAQIQLYASDLYLRVMRNEDTSKVSVRPVALEVEKARAASVG
jgi:hypothetical protein